MRKKPKFKSAEEKRKYEASAAAWQELLTKYKPKVKTEEKTKLTGYKLAPPPGREKQDIPSRDTGAWSTAPRREQKYSGDAMIGIGMMHKSNLVPIFKAEEAKDIASMRR